MFPFNSQSELLDESLALLSALDDAPLSSNEPWRNEPWWGKLARQELHDELFRYFVALGGYGSAHYVDMPRLALEACLSGQRTKPLGAPVIAKPVRLTALESKRALLRNRVRVGQLEADLKACFGSQIFSLGVQTSTVRPAAQLAAQVRRQLAFLPLKPVRHWENGVTDFTAHLRVQGAAKVILEEDCLPFGPSGVSLSRGITSAFDTIDKVESWLVYTMDETPHPPSPGLRAVGLALTVAARAYLTDVVCALVGVALPLHRLYEETRLGSRAHLSMSCPADPKRAAIVTKEKYNACMAIGLYELLTGERMPHLDSPPGNGYIYSPGALGGFCPLPPLLSFWGTDGAIHKQVVTALTNYQTAPILQVFYDPQKAKSSSTYLDPLNLQGLRTLILTHAFPARNLPVPEQPVKQKSVSKLSKKTAPGKSDDKAAYNICGHFITHLELYVATELATRLAAALTARGFSSLPRTGKEYINVSVGSLRWGGNHRPHKEHRDGFTYDISFPKMNRLPIKYEPWPTTKLKCPLEKGKRSPPADPTIGTPNEIAIGIPNDGGPFWPLHLTKKLDKHEQRITADKRLKGAFDNLVAALMSDESGDEADWDTLAGTPTLRKAGQWDNSALTANLIGHVALALSGVVKWVFASWYEHLFAIRAVSALLAPGKCPNPLETQVVAIRELISKAEFYWAPEDHHDHWHVVFAKANDPRHSLGPTPYVIDAIEPKLINWIRLWDALGVEFFPAPEAQPTLKPMFKQQLATREIQGHFPDAAKEKDDIVKELTNFETEVRRLSKDAAQARMTLRKQALDLVVSAIAAAKWSDIPSLADNPSYQDWVKNSQLYKDHKLIIPKGCRLDKWVPWPSDTDPLRPEELPPDSDTATDVA